MKEVKYLDHVKIYEGTKFSINTKHGKYSRRYFDTLEEAIKHAHHSGRNGFAYICLDNDKASDTIPDKLMKYGEAIELSKFAKSRYILLDQAKKEVLFEFFVINGSNYDFDYNILFGESELLYNGQTEVLATSGFFKNKKIVINTFFKRSNNRSALLDSYLPFNNADCRIVYLDDEYFDPVPSKSIK